MERQFKQALDRERTEDLRGPSPETDRIVVPNRSVVAETGLFQHGERTRIEVEPVHPNTQFCLAGQLGDLPELVRRRGAVTPGVDPVDPDLEAERP